MSVHRPSSDLRAWVGGRCARLVRSLIEDSVALGIAVAPRRRGPVVVDCGVDAPGTWEAGRRIVELSQGGLASAHLGTTEIAGVVLAEIVVESWQPALSAHGLQVSAALSEVDPAIRISGPILAAFDNGPPGWTEHEPGREPGWAIGILESSELPTADTIAAIARRSGRRPDELTLIVVPTGSVAGATQIAGRINECVMFTMRESLGLDPRWVTHLLGAAPIAPSAARGCSPCVTPDDCIHYAGRAVLTVEPQPGVDLGLLAKGLTFASTEAYGRRFGELLADADGVFEAIPSLVDLNKVAQVTVIDRRTGRVCSAGTRDEALLADWMVAADADRRTSG